MSTTKAQRAKAGPRRRQLEATQLLDASLVSWRSFALPRCDLVRGRLKQCALERSTVRLPASERPTARPA
jgi:hypothetical protein